ncbi:MAG: hypothetical protein AB8V79_00880 [Candidatus Midichloria sp.]
MQHGQLTASTSTTATIEPTIVLTTPTSSPHTGATTASSFAHLYQGVIGTLALFCWYWLLSAVN